LIKIDAPVERGGPLLMQNLTSDLIALADVFASERLVT